MKKFLLDTNIIIHYLADSDHSDNVEKFVSSVHPSSLHITLYSVYSIGILFTKFSKITEFTKFLDFLKNIRIISIPVEELLNVIATAHEHDMDFDDAYQYVAAEKYDLVIVSYDSDFDKTPRGRKTPEELLIKDLP